MNTSTLVRSEYHNNGGSVQYHKQQRSRDSVSSSDVVVDRHLLREQAEKLQQDATFSAQIGNDHDAVELYEKSLNLFYVVYGAKANNDYIARVLHALGILQSNMGKHIDARRRCIKALKMYDRLYGPEGKENERLLVPLLRLLVRLERKLGHPDAARVYQKRLSVLVDFDPMLDRTVSTERSKRSHRSDRSQLTEHSSDSSSSWQHF